MKGKLIKQVSLAVVSLTLILGFSLCSTGGDGDGDNVMWVSVWTSVEDLGGTAGTDYDIFFSRSTDNGVTWSAVQTLNSNANTDTGIDSMPNVIADGKSNWIAMWYSDEDLGGAAGTDRDIFFSRSNDNGATWSAVQTLNSNANTDAENDSSPNAATDGNGNWCTVWASNEDLGGTAGTDYDIFFSRSTDNGVTWSVVQTLNTNAASDVGIDFSPIVATDANGNWFTVWRSDEDLGGAAGTDRDIFFSRSNDNGATWSAVQTLNANANTDTENDENPRVTSDGKGNWVAVWYSNEDLGGTAGTDNDIFFSRSSDNGVTWSVVQTLNTNADTDIGSDEIPNIITDSNGSWVAVWRSSEDLGGTAGTDHDIFFSRSTDNGATWSAVQTLNANANTDTGSDYDHRVNTDGNGNWVAVLQSNEDLGGAAGTDYDIFVSRSSDNGKTWSVLQILNTNADTDAGDDWLF
jgi:Neuraminidase (sialidase)